MFASLSSYGGSWLVSIHPVVVEWHLLPLRSDNRSAAECQSDSDGFRQLLVWNVGELRDKPKPQHRRRAEGGTFEAGAVNDGVGDGLDNCPGYGGVEDLLLTVVVVALDLLI